ncbi:MAG: hypothetical protein IJ057_03785 [Bacteroidales bacterium]|nr:hypothetical protein [Bacteroidales bacterium]
MEREWKETLVNGMNPEWKDLAIEIGVDEEYMRSVKEFYDVMVPEEVSSKSVGDCGSSPQ